MVNTCMLDMNDLVISYHRIHLLHTIVYSSSATRHFSETELLDLLAVSRNKNRRKSITGMLLFKNQEFMQVLEGEREVIDSLFEEIKKDSGHQRVIKLIDREVEQRDFADWSMGFVNLEQAIDHDIPGYSHILNYPLTGNEFRVQPSDAQILLLSLKRTVT